MINDYESHKFNHLIIYGNFSDLFQYNTTNKNELTYYII